MSRQEPTSPPRSRHACSTARRRRARTIRPCSRATASSGSSTGSVRSCAGSASCSRARCCCASGRIGPTAPTRDLDLLRRAMGRSTAIRDDISKRSADGGRPGRGRVRYRGHAHRDDPRRGSSTRARARHCPPAAARHASRLQIDMGLGNAVVARAGALSIYPTLLDLPAPDVLAYPPEAVVAEKLEAMVVLGERNSRIKDFYDLISREPFEFDRTTLAEAVRRTFERRDTPIRGRGPDRAHARYRENPSRPAQVRAFAAAAPGSMVPPHPSTFAAPARRVSATHQGRPRERRGQHRRLATGRTMAMSAPRFRAATRPTRTPASSGWGRFRRIGTLRGSGT